METPHCWIGNNSQKFDTKGQGTIPCPNDILDNWWFYFTKIWWCKVTNSTFPPFIKVKPTGDR